MIYLDNNSTTQIDKKVLEEMMPYLNEVYGNSASRTHKFGWDSNDAVKLARERVSELINAKPDEIIFTSGSTEGINLIIKGIYDQYSETGNHIITVKTEHKAILDVCSYLENKGAEITYLNVNEDGLIDLEELQAVHPYLVINPIDSSALKTLLQGSSADWDMAEARYFVVTPDYQAVLYYTQQHDGGGLLEDLKHLLKYSPNR